MSILTGSHSSTHPISPSIPSGHASTSGAISHVLRLFFGSDVLNFQMTTTNPNAAQKTRFFTRFSQAEDEVVDARVYVGIHYRNTDRVSRRKVYVSRIGSLRTISVR